jgi:hypothetical protein
MSLIPPDQDQLANQAAREDLIYPLLKVFSIRLKDHLEPDEKVLACVPSPTGVLVVTNEQVIILKGSHRKDAPRVVSHRGFPLNRIESIDLSSDEALGRIQVNPVVTKYHSQNPDLATLDADNIVSFPLEQESPDVPGFQAFKEAVNIARELIVPPTTEDVESDEVPEGRAQRSLIYPLQREFDTALRESLDPGEEVLAAMPAGQELFVVTERRCIIMKTGLSSGAMWRGRKVKSFFFDQITSIEVSRGWPAGRLQISTPGTIEHGQTTLMDAIRAENMITFAATSKHEDTPAYPEFVRAAALVRQKVRETKEPKAVVSSGSLATELTKLAELHKLGVLTDAEFTAAKAKLLGL